MKLKNGILFILILLLSLLVHELGHCFSCILMGGKCYGIGLELSKGYAYARIHCDTKECAFITLIFGSLTSSIYGSIIAETGKKKNNYSVYAAGSSVVLSESFYWGISPFIKMGDCYILCIIFNLNLMFVGLFFIALTILLYILFLKKIKEVVEYV